MAYRVQDDVHAVVEIINLYYHIFNKEALDNKPSRLAEFGIDEESFEKKELKPINKYIDAFRNKSDYSKDKSVEGYFKDINGALQGECLAYALVENKDIDELNAYLKEVEGMNEDEIRKRLTKTICRELEDKVSVSSEELLSNPESRISYLDGQEISLETKWHIILILEKPKQYVLKLIEMILDSRAAYEVASKHIIKLKEKFIANLKEKVGQNSTYIKELMGIELEEFEIKLYPMIASYGTGKIQVYVDEEGFNDKGGIAFLGCYVDYMSELAKKNSTEKTEIINTMKLLGENSKFEIMQLLKKRPMYGIELAEKLSITPPTISHHMNNLIVHKLVKFEKIEGKFYYVLNQEKIEEILEEIKKQLLE